MILRVREAIINTKNGLGDPRGYDLFLFLIIIIIFFYFPLPFQKTFFFPRAQSCGEGGEGGFLSISVFPPNNNSMITMF